MRVLAVVLVLCVSACSDGGGAGGSGGTGGSGGDPSGPVDPLEGIGTVDLVSDGFLFTEGPVWRSATETLLFSDVVANLIHELTPPDSVEVIRENSPTNGLALDPDGLLLAADFGNKRITRTLEDGTIVSIVSEYEGDPFNSPNDVTARSDGTLYFTDPPFLAPVEERLIGFNGVFRVDPAGELIAEWEGADETRPNGLVLSPDESILYVADTTTGVMAFDVNPDGSLSEERTFVAEVPSADGMAMDAEGNLFVAAGDGVRVYDPDGQQWGTIEIPDGLVPANCAFGGSDARTLYITARQSLYKVVLANPGL